MYTRSLKYIALEGILYNFVISRYFQWKNYNSVIMNSNFKNPINNMISCVQSIPNHSSLQSTENGYLKGKTGEFSKRTHFCF